MARMTIRNSESLKFYIYLCQNIGSEEVVRIRRLVSTIRDIEVNGKIITSGSKGEGLNLNGSDCDIMIVDKDFKVYQSETKVQSFPIPLTMNTEDTPPCFTQLLLLKHNIKRTHHLLQKSSGIYVVKFNVTNKDKLITILTNSYEQGINFFANSTTLQDYQSHSEENPESEMSRYVGSLEEPIPIFHSISCCSGSVTNSRLLYYFLHHSRTALSRVLFALQISEASLQFPEETQYKKRAGQKHLYSIYKLDLNNLIIGLHSDTLYGLLKLASFFYVNKKYVDTLTVIRYALQKCINENIDTGVLVLKKTCNYWPKNKSNLGKKEKLHAMITSLRGHPFSFGVNSSIVPQELRSDVTRTPTSFHPLPFAHFLNFLCFYHLHDISACRQSLQRLKHLQRTLSCSTYIVWPYFLNTIILCGIADQLMGDTDSARTAFQEAARHDKHNVSSAASRLSSLI
ncbi:unnamed protein product [Mytilus edulis]|uniref:Uncharacterized protein n=1 Tax=Mytilus edulis TaxID=6550 RepID=A0A8S3UVD5_MYTED|nr:unnamed protein product [Mytilus edulis]